MKDIGMLKYKKSDKDEKDFIHYDLTLYFRRYWQLEKFVSKLLNDSIMNFSIDEKYDVNRGHTLIVRLENYCDGDSLQWIGETLGKMEPD